MTYYMVTLTVRHDAYEEVLNWLKTEHIREVLRVPGFTGADLLVNKAGALESSSKDVKVVYRLENADSLKTYLRDYAMPLRDKGVERFPGMFSAQREIWWEAESIS